MNTPTAEISQSDYLSWLRAQPSASVDLVLTDPPYESLEKHRAIGTTTRLKAKWFGVIKNEALGPMMQEFHRILRPHRHCYVMCDSDTAFHLKPAGEQAGFKFWKPIVWDKRAIGMGYHYRARYELIMFFEKGKRKLNNLGMPDVLEHKRLRTDFPTQKPEGLFEDLMLNSTQPGELVVDPFVGSGTTARVAVKNGRSFRGCDINHEWWV